MKTTKETERVVKGLDLFLFGEITKTCIWAIEEGEERCKARIKTLKKKYDLI